MAINFTEKCVTCLGPVTVEYFDRRRTMGAHCKKCNSFRTYVSIQGGWHERPAMTALEFQEIKEGLPKKVA